MGVGGVERGIPALVELPDLASLAAQVVTYGVRIMKEPQLAGYNGSILSGPEWGGVSKTRMIFRCATEITTILSLS
jgi:hypothetical protein